MQPHPTQSEKKVKPIACRSASKVKASGANLKRNSTPAPAPGSMRPRTMRTSMRKKRSGMRILLTRSIPLVTSKATMRPFRMRKSH